MLQQVLILYCLLIHFIFLGSKITTDGDCSHEIKRCLLLGRKVMTNLLLLLLLSRFSRVWLCATPWTAAHQAPPPLEFSRQEYWSGLPLPFPMLLICSFNSVFMTQFIFLKFSKTFIIFKSMSSYWHLWFQSLIFCSFLPPLYLCLSAK